MPVPEFIRPDWPAPDNVQVIITTRRGGASGAPWDSWNLGDHVGDDPAAVAENRRLLAEAAGVVPGQFGWLRQVHGTELAELTGLCDAAVPEADASWTDAERLVCAILTADCLPVLFCDQDGQRVAAAHAGWRSLAAGVLEKTVAVFPQPSRVLAYLGPAIGPSAFEVGPEVRETFLRQDPSLSNCFRPRGTRFMADLYAIARQRLAACGVHSVHGGDACTFSDPDHYFSYRRDGQTGRMASLIWRA